MVALRGSGQFDLGVPVLVTESRSSVEPYAGSNGTGLSKTPEASNYDPNEKVEEVEHSERATHHHTSLLDCVLDQAANSADDDQCDVRPESPHEPGQEQVVHIDRVTSGHVNAQVICCLNRLGLGDAGRIEALDYPGFL